MISRRQIRRFLAPTAPFTGSAILAVFGIVAFIFGLVLSFRVAASSSVEALGTWWNFLLEQWVGPDQVNVTGHLIGGGLLVLGLVASYTGIKGVLRQFVGTLNPDVSENMGSVFMRRQQLILGPRIVALGGGTGLSTLLRGLKQHTSNITAIVTVTDDGGSSGRLSEELGIIPPGDIRACLVALADSESQVGDIFQYRFKGGGSLSGHSLGNLLIAGLIDINGGDFERALTMASDVLAIRGRVIPSTLEHVRLKALLDDGSEITGETKIVESGSRIRRIFLDIESAHAYPEAIQAILDAEVIVIGPGSVYTSIIPNLLVNGVVEALIESKAKKVYVCNVMTQPGESDSFTACEHLLAIEANIPSRIFTHILVNTQMPSHEMVERYMSVGQFPVEPDIDRIRTMNIKVVPGDFMSETDYVRHDPIKVADAIINLHNRK